MSMTALQRFIHHQAQRIWYRQSFMSYCLLPLSWVFQFASRCRYHFYRWHRPKSPDVPVIVVGNLTVGGTGKTPVVAALVRYFQQQGFKPGIVMRGYHGKFDGQALKVHADTDPFIAGEEAVMLAHKTQTPVMIGAKRPSVIAALLAADPDINLIISDDGLQHYAMARDIEIAVIDGKRRFGNGFCLPAGPLREPKKRLKSVNHIIIQGGEQLAEHHTGEFYIQKQLSNELLPLDQAKPTKALCDWVGQTVHAVAGIGDPESFFALLKAKGLQVIPHVFPDHYHYTKEDLTFSDNYPIIMTEKDAIKCRGFEGLDLWTVPLEIMLPERLEQNLLRSIQQWIKNSSRSWLVPSASNL